MATGSRALESLRGLIEASEGAGGTPTRLLYPAIGGIALSIKNTAIPINVAWAKRQTTQDILAGIETDMLTLSNMPVSFQDFGWYLSLFDATGVASATGSGTPTTTDTTAFTRTFLPIQTDATVSATGTRSATFQYAPTDFASTAVWQLTNCVGEDLVVNFNKVASGSDTGVTMTAQFMSPKAATIIGAFTGSLSDRTQTYAVGGNLKAYVDTTTIGTTADPDITAAQFHLNEQNKLFAGMDNTNANSAIFRPSGYTTQLTYTKKFSNLTEYNAYVGTLGQKTTRKVRIIAEGAVVGAATAKNTIQLDFIGKYTDMSDVPQYVSDEIWAQNFTLDGVFDATLGADYKWTLINNVSTAYTAL